MKKLLVLILICILIPVFAITEMPSLDLLISSLLDEKQSISSISYSEGQFSITVDSPHTFFPEHALRHFAPVAVRILQYAADEHEDLRVFMIRLSFVGSGDPEYIFFAGQYAPFAPLDFDALYEETKNDYHAFLQYCDTVSMTSKIRSYLSEYDEYFKPVDMSNADAFAMMSNVENEEKSSNFTADSPVLDAQVISYDSDFSAYSDEELQRTLDAIRNELYKRQTEKSEDMIFLADQDGVQLYLTGNYWVKNYSSSFYLHIEYIFINDSDVQISVKKDSCYLNGWAASLGVSCKADPGKKVKDEFSIELTDLGITNLEEIDEVEISVYLRNEETTNRTYLPAVTIYFDN